MGDNFKDESILRHLYCEKGMTDKEIANKFNVSKGTISYWRNKFNIDSWSPEKYASFRPASYRVSVLGYPYWDGSSNDKTVVCYVHRLLAVSEYGFDALDNSVEIHHKNGVKWDNRSENIELIEKSEHRKKHGEERRNPDTGKYE